MRKKSKSYTELEQNSVNTLGHNPHPPPPPSSLGFVLEQFIAHNVLAMSVLCRQKEQNKKGVGISRQALR